MISGIYRILNVVNYKFYIGSSRNLLARWSQHKSKLNKNKHKNKHLQFAWNKYGEENFEFQILERTEDISKLFEIEQVWMNCTSCFNKKIGYNTNIDAESSNGVKRSKTTLKKISKARKNQKLSQETKEKIRLASLGNSHRRRKDKWPCEKGAVCKCKICIGKKRLYWKEYDKKRKLSK